MHFIQLASSFKFWTSTHYFSLALSHNSILLHLLFRAIYILSHKIILNTSNTHPPAMFKKTNSFTINSAYHIRENTNLQ